MCNEAQWNYGTAKSFLAIEKNWASKITTIAFSPLDQRHTIYDKNVAVHLRAKLSVHLYGRENIALVTASAGQEVGGGDWDGLFCVNEILQLNFFRRNGSPTFPLYRYDALWLGERRPNIAPAFSNRVAALTGLAWDDCVEGPKQGALAGVIAPKPTQTAMFATRRERGEPGHSFGPRDLFDWIYTVLHSPAYRSRYADYLKSDFARVPLPGSRALFEALVPLGTRLVALHLLDAAAAPDLAGPKPVRFVGSGEPRVAIKPEFLAGRVHINANCWFEDVPERAWNFHIGGYQPAQKWLKDRAAKGGKKASDGRVLTPEDILHYRRMITAMDTTIDLMAEIDRVIDQHGGWPDAFRGMAGG